MRKIYLLLIAFIAFSSSYSQEVYFLTGTNITEYNFSSEQGGMKTPLFTGTGLNYEMGYLRPLKNKRFSHSISVNLNDYNVVAGDLANSYKWNTKYFGVNNTLDFSVPLTTNFKLLFKAGLNLSTIIYGRQEINGAFYNIINQDEFSGLTFVPNTTLHLKYKLNDFGYLSFGYGFSRSVILFNISKEKLTTSTNQIVFGIHFNIIKK
jgi:hypothetical protein